MIFQSQEQKEWGNAMSENSETFFGDKAVKTVSLPEWMTLARERRVVLPMIQRGSVWAPHKLLDLWDTLLRGMPIGALMASDAVGKTVNLVPDSGSVASTANDAKLGDIALVDGQQRTLSMLAGWPQGLPNPLRPVAIWVDLADEPHGEYRFRLWTTTRAQPFGYARMSTGGQILSKLERQKLRLANQAFHSPAEKVHAQDLWKLPAFTPWESKFAIPLTELIENKATLPQFVQTRLADYRNALSIRISSTADSDAAKEAVQHFVKKLDALPAADDNKLTQRIADLGKALEKIHSYKFPLIHVRQESFLDDDKSSEDDRPSKDKADPPLAVLFKRVGSGGEPLSNADYVYAVIKHHAPQVHAMVNMFLEDEKVRAIYTPTTLVMSAVRMTILSLITDDDKVKKLNDSSKLDKADFARIVRNHSGFITAFEEQIKPGGIFAISLKDVLQSISYTTDFTTGLPKHALCLVEIPLLEVILAWKTQHKISSAALGNSRLAMVRFLLQGHLCVLDYAKASEVAIKALKEFDVATLETFPDQALLNLLAVGDKPLAYPLPSPETLSAINGLTSSPKETSGKETNGLRGWTRFVANGEHQKYADLYKRWWNRTGRHVHPMLLWLQRDYVFDEFEKVPALAGMDEETPFDFDHILPSAQWANWTGSGGDNRFIDFPIKEVAGEKILDDSGHRHIGNSIGNIHVLESSKNRELGDASVRKKLEIDGFAENALLSGKEQLAEWNAASESEGKAEDLRNWDEDRALSFQKAVEQRAFALYKTFYFELTTRNHHDK